MQADFVSVSEGRIRPGGSSSQLADKGRLGELQCGNGGFSRDRWEVIEELIERFPAFEVVQKRLKGNTGSLENGGSPQDLGVLHDHVNRGVHSCSPFALIIALSREGRGG